MTKTVHIDIVKADTSIKANGQVIINGNTVCEFGATDGVIVRNVYINAETGSIDEGKLSIKIIKDAVSIAEKRKKALSKKFSLSQGKLMQLKNDRDPDVSGMIKRLMKDDKDQVMILGINITLNNARV